MSGANPYVGFAQSGTLDRAVMADELQSRLNYLEFWKDTWAFPDCGGRDERRIAEADQEIAQIKSSLANLETGISKWARADY